VRLRNSRRYSEKLIGFGPNEVVFNPSISNIGFDVPSAFSKASLQLHFRRLLIYALDTFTFLNLHDEFCQPDCFPSSDKDFSHLRWFCYRGPYRTNPRNLTSPNHPAYHNVPGSLLIKRLTRVAISAAKMQEYA
jgi:hypothetical protein